nr:MAG TPA: hypothetical protein [Caudoviricetes sp.]
MAKIYGEVDNIPNSRLTRINMQRDVIPSENISNYATLIIGSLPAIIKNGRFNISPQASLFWCIIIGDGRAIDHTIRYKQLRKIYGFYISLSKSIYFHNYWFGNTKRTYPIYIKNYYQSRSEIIANNENTGRKSYLSIKALSDSTEYYGFDVSIDSTYSKHAEDIASVKYKKCSAPLYTEYNKKTEYTRYMDYSVSRLVRPRTCTFKSIDRFTFSPIRIPMGNVKRLV